MEFHLGPFGDLRELPPIERDVSVDASASAPAAEHVSLSGARTIDRLGPRRRTWDLAWKYLDEPEIEEIGALAEGMLGGPLWLVDPSRSNLLHRQVATAGSERKSPAGWSVLNGSRTWTFAAPVGRPPGVNTTGVIAWTRSTIADVLSVGRDTPRHRVPVLSDRRTVTVASMVTRTTPLAVGVRLGIDWWDYFGVLTTTFAPAVTVGALGPGTGWSDLTYTVTLPAAAVAFAPVWTIEAGQPSSTVLVAGARAGYGPVPPAPSSGGGTARVYVPGEGFTETYVSEAEWNAALKLVET